MEEEEKCGLGEEGQPWGRACSGAELPGSPGRKGSTLVGPYASPGKGQRLVFQKRSRSLKGCWENVSALKGQVALPCASLGTRVPGRGPPCFRMDSHRFRVTEKVRRSQLLISTHQSRPCHPGTPTPRPT